LLQKKISAAGFRLKGSGWYETDFKAGAKKNVANEGSTAPAACASPSSGTCSNNGCAS
jgi:predicted nucleic acid-binding Zn ribbon protein